MLGGHLDQNLRQKIIQHEYVDFAHLLPRDRVKSESDNRLEMVNQNGHTYWIPYSDRDNLSISSYHKWELAFRVFSNVYTGAHPTRASELLQYHHLIYSASQNFIWDNVYMYDIDFRIHLSNHPNRSWAAILQQAWSFRLKDRLTHFKYNPANSSDKSGNARSGKTPKLCTPFNQGYCGYGPSCKFEHKCALCSKYGHGAVNCRRGSNGGSSNSWALSRSGDSQHKNDRYHYHAPRDSNKQHQHGKRDDHRQ